MPKTLKVTLAFTICNVIQKGIAFLTIPFFTRLLTTSEMGQVTVYLSWLEIFTVFLTLQLPYGSFSKAMIKFDDSRDRYLSSVESICLLFSSIFLIIIYFFGAWLSSITHLSKWLLVLMTFEILSNSGMAFWNARRRMEYEYVSVVVITLLVSALSPLLSYILVLNFEERGVAKILGNSSIVIVFGFAIFVYSLLKGRTFFNGKYWKYALSFNIPLIPYYLSQIVFNSSDRIMIERLESEDKAGIYGVVYNLAFVLMFLLNSFNNAYTPWFLNKLKDDDIKDNKKLTIIVSAVFSLFILAIVLFAPEIIYILGGADYVEAVWIVPPVAMSLILLFYTQIFANYEFYYEKKIYLIISSISAAIINIVLNYYTIPKFGYISAGYTTFFSYLIMMLINYYAARKMTTKFDSESSGFDMGILTIIFVVSCALSVICMSIYNFLIVRLLIAVFTLVFLFVFRKKIWVALLMIRTIMKDEE